MAKVHPSARMNIEQLTRAMDDLDRRIRLALPFVADVFIDVTANRTEESSQIRQEKTKKHRLKGFFCNGPVGVIF